MNREIIIQNAAADTVIYEKVKHIIGKLGNSADTKIYIKDKDLKLIVNNQHYIDIIKKVLIENKISSTYVEIGD